MSIVRSEERTPAELSELLAILQAQGYGQATMGALFGEYLALPGLLGFWPGTGLSGSGRIQIADRSGNGLHLTNGSAAITYVSSIAAIPHIVCSGVTSYVYRADEGALDVSGTEGTMASAYRGLTFGGWVRFTSTSGAQALIAKYNPGSNDRSYYIYKNSSQNAVVDISSDGTAVTSVTHTSTMAGSTWYFMVGVFSPSASLSVWLNDTKVTSSTSIPASIFNSAQELRIGRLNDGTAQLDGRISLPFLCAAAVPDNKILSLYHMGRRLFGA